MIFINNLPMEHREVKACGELSSTSLLKFRSSEKQEASIPLGSRQFTSSITEFLDSVLGKGDKASGTNRKYLCPFPGCANRPSRLSGQKKLEIDTETTLEAGKPINVFSCWSCRTSGKSIYSLLRKIGAPEQKLQELSSILKYTELHTTRKDKKEHHTCHIPLEFQSLIGKLPKYKLPARHAKVYVKGRGLTEEDIIKYNIGYCDEGRYRNRVVTPSYDSQMKLNYLIGRTLAEETFVKYEFPESSRDIIPFDSMVNWSKPIIICEGVFDMFTIKRNCIPLLGKDIQPELMKKLLTCESKKVYICLDNDALKESLKHCESLMGVGKTVYLVELQDKDPGSMTFEEFTRLIQQVKPLTAGKMLKLKIGKR